ncbi:protoporphyrinogen oxidase HemJ [Candidatus Pseudomonas adelgestsugas]|uniref:Protoporphyrinogen IX oxidase n=1 Tax=Candidatus Pseudomonas adelgestsugas TaxID=1302376 RepID=A0ABX5R7P5_9PSED|nr:protoporphyrinogen oxidase HemJ [Candidatus Pseudomonas adelgestsugas]QAX81499.1 Copper resistance protein D [Candidatus Pseudomonas adelgestsugas]
MLYLWIKAFHIVSIVCWFAGLFYLPRLFVYHAQSEDAVNKERFSVMEHRLYHSIMGPAMIATLVFGSWLIQLNQDVFQSGAWIHAKLTLLVILLGYHAMCGIQIKRFASDENTHSHIFYRWFNEVPILILLAIVILVVVKPF